VTNSAVREIKFESHKKGDHKDLNNHQGVALQDLMSRLLSSILSKRPLDGPIALCGTQTQFGSQTDVGCRDAIFTIRSMLQLRRCHNLPTWTLCLDLAKAFGTANHQLLFKLLRKFGVPEHTTGPIERLHKDAEIKIKMGRKNRTIPCSAGVKQQGDNMAPVPFLFLVQALSETQEKEWKDWLTEDIQIVATLKEWRAQSKKRLRQWTLERERHEERQRTQNRIREA
jgi:hypothetical protein